MSAALKRLLARWRAENTIGGNVTVWEKLHPRESRTRPLPVNLHPALREALCVRGIAAIYTHQARAWELTHAGENCVLATPTASGKTLAYNLPVLDTALRDPQATALYIFPTKALAQDQLQTLTSFLSGEGAGVKASIYDGDTPSRLRPAIRRETRLLLTNPDMLHYGILPGHTRWGRFFRGLRYVVIDEVHVYRGVFGSHVANLLRRLERVARFYGARPQYLLTSATIGNPRQLAGNLIGAPVRLIAEDGAARGPKHFLLYTPPLVDEELGLRRGVLSEASRLASDLLAAGLQTLVFARSRRNVEHLVRDVRAFAPTPGPSPNGGGERGNPNGGGERSNPKRGRRKGDRFSESEGERVVAYHSNYLPAERREMERGLREGRVRLAAATNALELGMDIGGMQAVLMAGYPGTLASTWQQAGRAGRGAEASLAVLLLGSTPLEQYLARHPEYIFGQSPERALVNPDHPLILLDHLQCAAAELPLEAAAGFGNLPPDEVRPYLEYLAESGLLRPSRGRYYWSGTSAPARGVGLRNASAGRIALYTPAGLLATVDTPSAPALVHPGAVYLHDARPYLVQSLDFEKARADLLPADEVAFFTRPQRDLHVELAESLGNAPLPKGSRAFGELRVTRRILGYRQIHWETRQTLGVFPLEMPPQEMLTQGFWLALDEAAVEALAASGLWRGAPNDYGPDWPRLREQVRARDGYRCRVCGAPEGGRAHHVHHKTPFRLFADPAEANRPENLVTLCPACHRRAEQGAYVRSGLAGLGYLLHNLAPLLLMCDPADLGRHSDPRSPLAEGRPAVLLYENTPGGLGFSAELFGRYAELLAMARRRIEECPCAEGCPSCTGPGGEEGSGGKRETAAILEMLGPGDET